MNDRKFSRRKKGPMRFRPTGGIGVPKISPEARTEATAEKAPRDEVFNYSQHQTEIERAENLAAGLPPDAEADSPQKIEDHTRDFREPHLDTPEVVQEEHEAGADLIDDEEDDEFTPVHVPDKPQGLVESIRFAADKIVRKVQRLIKPVKRVHKEVIINAESLETRVAVLEDGKLEEFTIERTTDERLVGSVFKGKVKNLEDGLKAAFVDIGFEKNAFLHYWDIVPAPFDSSYEVVEREGRKREKPRITQKDIPRLYPPGSEIIVQVTKGPIGTKGPRVTTNLALPGRYLVLLPNSDQSGISRKIENVEERQRLKRIVRSLNIPDGMGVIIRTAGEEQQARYFVRDLALLLEEWREVQDKINRQHP
jgi:ribonuclease G